MCSSSLQAPVNCSSTIHSLSAKLLKNHHRNNLFPVNNCRCYGQYPLHIFVTYPPRECIGLLYNIGIIPVWYLSRLSVLIYLYSCFKTSRIDPGEFLITPPIVFNGITKILTACFRSDIYAPDTICIKAKVWLPMLLVIVYNLLFIIK